MMADLRPPKRTPPSIQMNEGVYVIVSMEQRDMYYNEALKYTDAVVTTAYGDEWLVKAFGDLKLKCIIALAWEELT